MREVRFALGYLPHRIWGNILQAQFLEREAGREFYYPREYIQNDPGTLAYQRLTPMQREILGHVDAYSDRNLHRKFSKKGTTKEFLETVGKETVQGHIRPFIEQHLHVILEIARDNRIAVFVKDKSNRNVFPEDFVHIDKIAADPQFSFKYGDRLTYSLMLLHDGKRLPLKGKPLDIVCNRPCVIILEDHLYFVNEIDGKKLIPFRDKEDMLIPEGMEEKYFSSFVRNTLRDFDAVTDGFTVEDFKPARRIELVLEEGINQQPVWNLYFWYNEQRIFHDSPLKRFVQYSGKGGRHIFKRFLRDPLWEEGAIEKLNEVGLRSRDLKHYHLRRGSDGAAEKELFAAINFTNEIEGELRQTGIEIGQRLQKKYYLGGMELKLSSKETEDGFDMTGEVRFGAQRFSFLSLRNHILEGNREFDLPGGEVAVLPRVWMEKYRSLFEFGKIEEDAIRIHKQHFSLVEEPIRPFHAGTLDRLRKLNEVGLLPESPLPAGLKSQLRKYQIEGFTWMWFLKQNGFGGCLADDMGLGKTIQAIAVLLAAKEAEGERKTSLVIVPASLLHNWISECSRFAPELKVYPYLGMQRNKSLSNLTEYDLILSTYHTVRQDIDSLSDFSFYYVILDESQMIKNPSSKLYQAVIELRAEHRMVLTGTPIENSLTDLWSQINFVNPGLLGTLNFFKRSFVQPIERKGDEDREEKLKELINPFILRRTKQQVARELPPVFEQVRYCSMSEAQRRIYEEERSLARNSILENLEEIGMERSTMLVLRALTRLRQIANHPAMIEDFREIDSGKFAEVYRDLESIISEGHKVLVFSSFVKHLELFREQLEKDRVPHAYLTGSHNQQQRRQAVKDFQRKKGHPLFLISLKAGGVGLNLTEADYVFILDPWWNPAAEVQALNRAHRIGQEKNVFVYRFISSDSIEEKIQLLQKRKQELSETFITSHNPLKEITEKELVGLFS